MGLFRKSVLLGLFLFICNLQAGTTGRIAGRVTTLDGEPILYANIVLEGEGLGIQTDENGRYLLRSISSGKHVIICNKLGYESKKIVGLQVSIDETTVQNFRLKDSAMEVPGITVSEAKNKLVDKMKTSSGKVITQQSIEEVSVSEIEDIVAMQAGAFVNNGELHIRGGRMNEVVYVVDGISVTDIVDGIAALAIDVEAIQEIKVMTGGFPAEYGNAQSGIINIITKSGDSSYHGQIKASGDWISNSSNTDSFSGNLSGPIFPTKGLRDKLNFFLSYKLERSNTYLNGNFGANAYDDITSVIYGGYMDFWKDYDFYDPDYSSSFQDFFTEERVENDQFLNLKLNYKFSNTEKLSFAIRQENYMATPYNHYWKYALEHYKKIDLIQDQVLLNYTKTYNSNLTWETRLGYYKKSYSEAPRDLQVKDLYSKDEANFDLYADNYSGNCSGIEYLGDDGVLYELDQNWYYSAFGINYYLGNYFASPGSYYTQFIQNENTSYTFKTDLDFQYNQIHNFRSGCEIIQHEIDRQKFVNPYSQSSFLFSNYLSHQTAVDSVEHEFLDMYVYLYSLDDIYDATIYAAGQHFGVKASTTQFNYYLQDRMEWEGLVINAGARLDGWYLGKDYQQQQYEQNWEAQKIDTEDRLHLMLSPRIGISHAISERSVMHIAFNYQNQLPQLKNVYPDATSYQMMVGTQEWTAVVIANPKIKPQVSIAGEVGLQHQFTENLFIDGTVYYKKNYNYPSIEKFLTDSQGFEYYYRYVTNNYGTVKGLDLNLEKTLSNFFSASMAYSLSWADGTDSEYYDFEPDYEVPNREFPLDWDSRHNLGLNLNFKILENEDLYLPYTDFIIPIHDLAVNYSHNYASGVPILGSVFANTGIKRKKHTQLANLKISKGFQLMKLGLSFFVNINNLYEYENIAFAYLSTGSPYDDGTSFDDPHEQYLHEMNNKNPENINSNREIIIGVSLGW